MIRITDRVGNTTTYVSYQNEYDLNVVEKTIQLTTDPERYACNKFNHCFLLQQE